MRLAAALRQPRENPKDKAKGPRPSYRMSPRPSPWKSARPTRRTERKPHRKVPWFLPCRTRVGHCGQFHPRVENQVEAQIEGPG